MRNVESWNFEVWECSGGETAIALRRGSGQAIPLQPGTGQPFYPLPPCAKASFYALPSTLFELRRTSRASQGKQETGQLNFPTSELLIVTTSQPEPGKLPDFYKHLSSMNIIQGLSKVVFENVFQILF